MEKEESNLRKLTKLIPDLQKMAEQIKTTGEASDKGEDAIVSKFKVRFRYEEGYYYVSVGKKGGAFDLEDAGNDEVDEIEDAGVRARVVSAGKALRKNSQKWRTKLYSICEKLGWNVLNDEEYTFEIEKNGLRLDISNNMRDYRKYIVESPIERTEVGHAARAFLQHLAWQAKRKEEEKRRK